MRCERVQSYHMKDLNTCTAKVSLKWDYVHITYLGSSKYREQACVKGPVYCSRLYGIIKNLSGI